MTSIIIIIVISTSTTCITSIITMIWLTSNIAINNDNISIKSNAINIDDTVLLITPTTTSPQRT